jgi:hypothetical protein
LSGGGCRRFAEGVLALSGHSAVQKALRKHVFPLSACPLPRPVRQVVWAGRRHEAPLSHSGNRIISTICLPAGAPAKRTVTRNSPFLPLPEVLDGGLAPSSGHMIAEAAIVATIMTKRDLDPWVDN